MAHKPRMAWDDLKPAYRKRLINGGITKEAHQAGRSLKRARGHEHTPEHVNQTVRQSEYPEYFAKRQALIRELEAKKQRLWGDSPRWSVERSSSNIRVKPVSNTMLQWAIDADEDDLVNAIREDSDAYRFVGYH